MDERKLRRYVFLLNSLINRFDGQILSKMQITSAQAKTIYFLAVNNEKEICQKDIDKCFGITHSTSNGILRRLLAKGLICESVNEKDRRFKNYNLTEDGYKIYREFTEKFVNEHGMITEGLTNEELLAFERSLRKMISNIR